MSVAVLLNILFTHQMLHFHAKNLRINLDMGYIFLKYIYFGIGSCPPLFSQSCLFVLVIICSVQIQKDTITW